MDTIYQTCGLMVLKLEDVSGSQPFVIDHYVQSSPTWFTIGIVALICITIIAIALIAKCVISTKYKNGKESKELKHIIEEVDKLKEKIVDKDEVKRKYTEKLAIFLEDLSKNEKNSKMKDISDKACKEYMNTLTHMAKDGNMDKYQSYENNDTPKK